MIKRFFLLNKIKFLLLFVLVMLHPLYLPWLGRTLVVNDKLTKADVIFVPAGDNSQGNRTKMAISLYKKGWAKRLLLSGDDIAWRTNSADIMEKQALYYGVPKESIIKIEHNADSSLAESRIVKKVLIKHKIDSVILVTSNYHSKRAKRLAGKGFGDKIDLTVYPVKDNQYYPDPDSWWKSRRQAKTFIQETLKTLWSYIEG